MKKLIVNKEYPNGIEIDLTAEEIAQKKIDEQNSIANFQKEEQARQDAINKKASGKQKLLDLGLTEEEVKALIGV
jgi:hypothetical protein